MRPSHLLPLLLLLVVVVGCGGDSKGSPSSPTPVLTSITVTGADRVRNGQSQTYTASASPCVWGGDNPSVGTIDGAGRFTAAATGDVTIWCDSQGVRGTKRIRVTPDFQGAFSGSYNIQGCAQDGIFAVLDFCDDFRVGQTLPLNLNLVQPNDTSVTGRFYFGSLAGDGQGPIDSSGELTFTGTVYESAANVDAVWRLRSEKAGRITGTIQQRWRANGYIGSMTVTATIRDCNKSTSSSAPMSLGPVSPTGLTLEQLRAAIAR